MVTRSEPGYTWDFCGGHLALDFTNTVGNRGGRRQEHFNAWDDVLAWAVARGVLSPREASARRLGYGSPHQAATALVRAVELREALYRTICAAATGRPRTSSDLVTLNKSIARTFGHARLEPAGRTFVLSTPGAGADTVEAVTAPVVRAAVDLLTSPDLSRVRACADQECAWLFLDTTRSRTRRWCDMKVCGNRDKVRRFRTRTK
jgi:predicted RNA-binding Zn ribbon-like protein